MRGPLVIGQSGGLSVCLVAYVTRVRLVVRVDHVVLIQARVFCEAFVTSGNLAQVGPFA